MSADTAIAQRIRTELAAYLKRDPGSLSVQNHLRDDLGLDSMATIELLFRIEEAFDLQIPDEDLPGLVTMGTVIDYVESRLHPPSRSTAAPRPKTKPSQSAKRSPARKPAAKKKG
ncbi:MAG: acyl carrier protein [Nitrospirales bacterium]